MGAAQRYSHSSHTAGNRITSHRPVMKQFDRHTFVKAEFPEATGFVRCEAVPVDRGDAGALP